MMSDVSERLRCSESENFHSPAYSKFAVECDWNQKNCQNVRNLRFLYEAMGFILNKLEFLKIGKICPRMRIK